MVIGPASNNGVVGGKVLGSFVQDGQVFLNVLVGGQVAVCPVGVYEAKVLAGAAKEAAQ